MTLEPDTTASRRGQHLPAKSTEDDGQLLALAMSLNVIFSGLAGLTLTGGGWLLDGWLGAPAWVLTALGVGLVAFAARLLWLLAHPDTLVREAGQVIAADAVWVVGAVLVILAGDVLTTAGNVALLAVTAVVASLAIMQVAGFRRTGGSDTVSGTWPVSAVVSREISTDPERVWAAVADAGAYAAFADGIAKTEVEGASGEGMVRVCTDDRGDSWSERCTLWEDGRRYRMTVDVDSYPWHYRTLLHRFEQTWQVEPAPSGARVTLRFDGQVKLGIIGRMLVATMGRGGRLEAILDRYDRELTSGAS